MIVDSTDTTYNPSANTQVIVTTAAIPDGPTPSSPPRTNQQRVIPNAIQNRFLNMVQQWPTPVDSSLVAVTDFKQTDIQTLSSSGGKVAAFNFIFQNTNTQPVFVKWCGTLFIDGLDSNHAYPEPGQTDGTIAPTDWAVEAYSGAYFGQGLNGDPFLPNQLNQDSQLFTVKFIGTGTHEIVVQYYWRAIINQGGSATPTTLGQ